MGKRAYEPPEGGRENLGIEIGEGEIRWYYGDEMKTSFKLKGEYLDDIGRIALYTIEDVLGEFGDKILELHEAAEEALMAKGRKSLKK